MYRYAFLSSDGITTTFETAPFESSFLMGRILNDRPMFAGVTYAGDPLVRTEIAFCEAGTIECDFPVVAITLRARPDPTSVGAATPLELHEEVRIRSA